MLGTALATGKLAALEDGPLAWTSHSNLVEAAAILLGRRAATA